MSKHSKAPWVKNRHSQILDSNGQRVRVDGFAFGVYETGESQANDQRIVGNIGHICVDVYDIGRHTRQEIVDIAKRHQYTRYDKASGEFVDNMLAGVPQASFVNVLFYLNG